MHSIVADITPRRGLHLGNRWSVSKAAALGVAAAYEGM